MEIPVVFFRSIAALLVVFALFGCNDTSSPPDTIEECPKPVVGIYGPFYPLVTHKHTRTSATGRYVIYQSQNNNRWPPSWSIHILDMATGRDREIDYNTLLRPTERFTELPHALSCCPYDDSTFLAYASVEEDTTGDNIPDKNRTYFYILNITGQEIARYWSTIFLEKPWTFPAESCWLAGSNAECDSFLLQSVVGPYVYIPQKDIAVPSSQPLAGSQSRNGQLFFGVDGPQYTTTLNGQPLPLPFHISDYEHSSWSPDGKTLAVSVHHQLADLNLGYFEVRLLDIDRYLREGLATVPSRSLDFRELFCMYSLRGTYPEFLTDSTLVVAMHRAEAEQSVLWEITTSGYMVRQLTFPE